MTKVLAVVLLALTSCVSSWELKAEVHNAAIRWADRRAEKCALGAYPRIIALSDDHAEVLMLWYLGVAGMQFSHLFCEREASGTATQYTCTGFPPAVCL